ncbi:MAG: hypothetical protein V4534_06870 [Myxococcota bacterium]
MKNALIILTLIFLSYAQESSHADFSVLSTPASWTLCEPPLANDSVSVKRKKYVCEIEKYLPLVQIALQETNTSEREQAKILHQLRRDIGKRYKDLTPAWLRQNIYCRNHHVYQDPLGPTYEHLTAKGKKDAEIIASAARTGGKDILLDNYYAVKMVELADQLDIGHRLNYLWSWVPGKSCPYIE